MRGGPVSSITSRWAVRVLLAALTIVGVIIITSVQQREPTSVVSGERDAVPSGTAAPSPAPPAPVATTDAIAMPTPAPTPTAFAFPTPTPEFGPTGRPSAAQPVNVLTATDSVGRPEVYDAPNGNVIKVGYTYLNGSVDPTYDDFTNPTYFGNPLAMMVVEGEEGDEWAQVQIPTRPMTRGWIRTADFEWSRSDYYVRINLADNTVKVWDGDKILVDSTKVVTGDAGRSTPVAATFIDEIMRGPSSAYGPWLLSLGVFSDSINTFSGGLPKVAMHGTNRPDLLGQYASNGCIRLPNAVITLLADNVPVGTRVDIVRET